MLEVVAVGLAVPALKAGQKTAGNWLQRKYRYVKHIGRNWENLQQVKHNLIDKKSGIETELTNNSSHKEKTAECERWLTRMIDITNQIEEAGQDYRNKPCTCFYGLCPFPQLLKLGKRIVEMTSDATSLYNNLSEINIMQDKPTPTPHGRRWNSDVRIVNHPSLENNVAKLVRWLKDERSMKRICIWGPPGVGKTTMMKTVLNKLTESCHFDYIFRVTVSTESIQEVILNDLGNFLDENTNPRERAAVISAELEAKKYLLFLEDVSMVVNLGDVGIQSNHAYGKVVFACREKYTGHTDEDMNILGLSEEDATQLFWKAVGSKKKGKFKPVAEQIINLCGGMPPLLNLIGKNLATKNDLSLWRNMKSRLQSPSDQPWKEWEEYYKSFKLVYNELTADGHKHCLLYWAIFPLGEEINRDHIIDCWATEEFLLHQRLCDARDSGDAILNDFMEKCLLEKGKKLGHFKMFVCFQRAAFSIANQDDSANFFVQNGESIEKNKWEKAKRVSLTHTDQSTLPKMPKCTEMVTLLLHENSSTDMPGKFFASMRGLKLLCLQGTRISRLPSSLTRLINLKGLLLYNCHELVHLPQEIGSLQNLEIFVISHSGIFSLPDVIGGLGNLECFRISFKEAPNQNNPGNLNPNGTEEMIPSNIMGKLSKLQELTLDVRSNITAWNKNADVIASEITMLEGLTHLHFYFYQMNSLQHFIDNSKSWNKNNFRSFSICVGEQENTSASSFNEFECSAEKHFKFSGGDNFPVAVFEVLKQATSFELIGHKTATCLTDSLPADALQDLEVLNVGECNEMLNILFSNTDDSVSLAFQCLKELRIRKLPKLVSICQGRIASESFRALMTLKLEECQSITKLFDLETASQLSNLQNLHVENCRGIKNIIEGESSDELMEAFPKLKTIHLFSLPCLLSISNAPLTWHSLKRILINRCEGLKGLPHILENAPELEEVCCAEAWWDQHVWPEGTKEHFSSLRRDVS